jgi:hypothetical protein
MGRNGEMVGGMAGPGNRTCLIQPKTLPWNGAFLFFLSEKGDGTVLGQEDNGTMGPSSGLSLFPDNPVIGSVVADGAGGWRVETIDHERVVVGKISIVDTAAKILASIIITIKSAAVA